MVKTKFTSLPNLIADEEIVPELSQDECTVENIVFELTKLLRSDQSKLIERFTKLHLLIKCDADQKAADAVIKLINEGQ
jgi:lipid-A-disaccharide synthase